MIKSKIDYVTPVTDVVVLCLEGALCYSLESVKEVDGNWGESELNY